MHMHVQMGKQWAEFPSPPALECTVVAGFLGTLPETGCVHMGMGIALFGGED